MIAIFNSVLWSFHYVILPICFILGNLGNCLNLLIFSQRSSRSNSCLLYFLSASIVNFFILNVGLPLRILRGIWNIDPALQFVWFCRCRMFLVNSFILIYRCSILLACIDRMCASSRSARMRAISQPKVAYWLIALVWILTAAYFSPLLVFLMIIFGQCMVPPGSTYATFSTISVLVQGLLIPLSMIVCGLITLQHLKLMKTQVTPGNTAALNERKVVGQFLIMLFIQVIVDCLCNILYPCYLLASLLIPALPTLENGAITSFLINFSLNVSYLSYSAGFYLYTLSSSSFRRKVLRLLERVPWFRRFLLVNQENNNTHTLPMVTMRTGNINTN